MLRANMNGLEELKLFLIGECNATCCFRDCLWSIDIDMTKTKTSGSESNTKCGIPFHVSSFFLMRNI